MTAQATGSECFIHCFIFPLLVELLVVLVTDQPRFLGIDLATVATDVLFSIRLRDLNQLIDIFVERTIGRCRLAGQKIR